MSIATEVPKDCSKNRYSFVAPDSDMRWVKQLRQATDPHSL